MNEHPMIHVGTSFGKVHFKRSSEDHGDKPWSTPEQPWLTAYRITGSQISGTVRIAPKYDEPPVPHGNGPDETDWELLPSGFYVGYGRAHNVDCEGSLQIWGSRLAGGVEIHTRRETNWDFPVRRLEHAIGDRPAPQGVRAKTRELIRALLDIHQEDTALVREKAAEYARHQRPARIARLAEECRKVDRRLRALQDRDVELRLRLGLMRSDMSFEAAVESAVPKPGGTWSLGPARPAFGLSAGA